MLILPRFIPTYWKTRKYFIMGWLQIISEAYKGYLHENRNQSNDQNSPFTCIKGLELDNKCIQLLGNLYGRLRRGRGKKVRYELGNPAKVGSSPVFRLSSGLSGLCPSSFTRMCLNGVYFLTVSSQTLLEAIHHNWQLRLHSLQWWKVWVGFCCAKENPEKNLFSKGSAQTTTLLCRKMAEILPLFTVGLWFFSTNTRITLLQLQGFRLSALQGEHRVIPWNLQNCCRSMGKGRGSFISLCSGFPHSVNPWVGLDSSLRPFLPFFTHRGGSMCVYLGIV